MIDPELGFVDAEKEGTSTRSTYPNLNAQPEHTHVVEDGATQVVGGGIQCALDGGTFQIGMYDITDGVDGEAPRVFAETISLPERPQDGEDGYEVDSYTFEIDPVPLRGYVGRELAVAAVHDSERVWGNDWFNPDATFYRGTGSLSDPWEGDLQDGHAPRSMGLFVEPVDAPEGKDRTVIGEDVFDDLSRTVFAAFPDRTPETGMAIQFDEQTAAGAPVAVLENGVVRVGQGSTETDSFEVSVRDLDGTWHGPRPITLADGPGPVDVTASSETISPTGTATLSLTAEAVETVTVRALWTDWEVSVDSPDGAATTDSVSEAGEFELQWNTVRNTAAPALAIDPPADTYVGGTYAIDVVAERDGQSATDTALLEIQSGSATQPTTESAVAATTDDSETSLVASRAVDGSRLTSRPNGPVYHTNDGSAHLFTWDEPGPGARAVIYDEDDSTDWGGGPDLHVYDTMERPDAEAGDTASVRATYGDWQRPHSGEPGLRPNSHSGDFSVRVQDQNDLNRFQTEFAETTEVFLSYCVKIPDGKAMLGADEPGQFPESSVWKMAWLFHDDTGVGEDVDICLPSWTPSLSVGGNNLSPDIWDDASWWQWGEWMRLSFWLECGDDPETDPGRVRWQVVAEGDQTSVRADKQTAIMEDGVSPYSWKQLNLPGWSSNKDVSGENVEALYDDIYVATGANSNARVELSDDSVYGDSTRMQLCKIRSWQSNRVSAILERGSLSSVEGSALHLTTADEQQAVSMEVN